MDPKQNGQNDSVDPLELQDQEDSVEEDLEEATTEDEVLEPVKEEQELVQAIDTVAAPVEENDSPAVKKGSHVIPRHLIDRELTADDLFDDNLL